MIINQVKEIKHRKTKYFPVLIGSIENTFTRYSPREFNEGKAKNFACSPIWYNKDNPFYYNPRVLLSAAHFHKKKDIHKKIHTDDDTETFVDSGGYQLSQQVKAVKGYTREIALNWSEENGDIFPILDYPVAGKISPEEAISYTIESAKYYADNRSVSGKTILNVLSAKNYLAMDRWYDAVKEFKFEGWACGGHGNNNKTQIQSLLYLLHKGELDRGVNVPVHIFGTSSTYCIPYLICIQNIFNRKGINCTISFDSSYPATTAIRGRLFMFNDFFGFKAIRLSNAFDYSNIPDDATLPCSCPICEGVTDLKHLTTKWGIESYTVLCCHNFWCMFKYKEAFERLFYLNMPEILDSMPVILKNNIRIIVEAFEAASLKKAINIMERGYIPNKTSVRATDHSLTNFM